MTRYGFTSLFPIEMSSVSFPCLIILAATPSTVLNACMCTELCPTLLCSWIFPGREN